MIIDRMLGLKVSTVLQNIVHSYKKKKKKRKSANTGDASKFNLETHGGSSTASNLCHKTWV